MSGNTTLPGYGPPKAKKRDDTHAEATNLEDINEDGAITSRKRKLAAADASMSPEEIAVVNSTKPKLGRGSLMRRLTSGATTLGDVSASTAQTSAARTADGPNSFLRAAKKARTNDLADTPASGDKTGDPNNASSAAPNSALLSQNSAARVPGPVSKVIVLTPTEMGAIKTYMAFQPIVDKAKEGFEELGALLREGEVKFEGIWKRTNNTIKFVIDNIQFECSVESDAAIAAAASVRDLRPSDIPAGSSDVNPTARRRAPSSQRTSTEQNAASGGGDLTQTNSRALALNNSDDPAVPPRARKPRPASAKSDLSRASVLEIVVHSDGDKRKWSDAKKDRFVQNDRYFHKEIGRKWSKLSLPKLKEGFTYWISGLPNGYAGFERERAPDTTGSSIDRRIYGHPDGFFDSLKKFMAHFTHGQFNNGSFLGCQCVKCDPQKRDGDFCKCRSCKEAMADIEQARREFSDEDN